MAATYKILGQVTPLATTETLLYVTPGATQAVISSLVCCNRGPTASSFRISVSPAGIATANNQYLYYDVSIPANDTFVITGGLTLGATDEVRVYAGNANLSFSAWGSEVT